MYHLAYSALLHYIVTVCTCNGINTLVQYLQGDANVMDMTELRQHLNIALNEAVRLRAETDSLRTTHVR